MPKEPEASPRRRNRANFSVAGKPSNCVRRGRPLVRHGWAGACGEEGATRALSVCRAPAAPFLARRREAAPGSAVALSSARTRGQNTSAVESTGRLAKGAKAASAAEAERHTGHHVVSPLYTRIRCLGLALRHLRRNSPMHETPVGYVKGGIFWHLWFVFVQ